MKTFLRFFPAVFVMAIVAVSTVQAEVYRWVDEEGNVQFGDRPLDENAESVKIRTYKPDTKNIERIENQMKGLDERAGDRAQEAQTDKDTKEKQAERDKYCGDLNERLTLLESGARLSVVDDSGERQVMDEEKRQQDLEKTRSLIEQLCQ